MVNLCDNVVFPNKCESAQVLALLVYICIAVGDPVINKGVAMIALIGLIHICVSLLRKDLYFTRHSLFVFNNLRRYVVVCCVYFEVELLSITV
jgi:hypothetical protein